MNVKKKLYFVSIYLDGGNRKHFPWFTEGIILYRVPAVDGFMKNRLYALCRMLINFKYILYIDFGLNSALQ